MEKYSACLCRDPCFSLLLSLLDFIEICTQVSTWNTLGAHTAGLTWCLAMLWPFFFRSDRFQVLAAFAFCCSTTLYRFAASLPPFFAMEATQFEALKVGAVWRSGRGVRLFKLRLMQSFVCESKWERAASKTMAPWSTSSICPIAVWICFWKMNTSGKTQWNAALWKENLWDFMKTEHLVAR